MDILSLKQQRFCENVGVAGILLSVTCLIQHMVFMLPHWITYSIIFLYLLLITGYAMLAKLSRFAFVVLLTGTILLFFTEAYMILTLAFSLVILLLLLFSIVVVVLMMVDNLQGKLKENALAKSAEEEKWKNLI